MENIVFMIEKLIPDYISVLKRRYEVLKTVDIFQPVGRRNISTYVKITERVVRSDIEKLTKQGLVTVSKSGISITEKGIEVLKSLDKILKKYNGILIVEKKIENILGVKKVHIVQGNFDENNSVKNEIGKFAADVLMSFVKKNSIITITGGTTVATVVDGINQYNCKKAEMILPARGSVGKVIELQSDILASKLADKLFAKYRLLNIPDNINSKALCEIMNEPSIQKTISNINKSDILLLGLGEAFEMAKKRKVSEEIYNKLIEEKAVAEAFGYYFDKDGKVIYETNSVGLSFYDICNIPNIIAVACGKNKAESIIAICQNLYNMTIVIDEGAANQILKIKEDK